MMNFSPIIAVISRTSFGPSPTRAGSTRLSLAACAREMMPEVQEV
jgi:hypothetical protein